MNLEQRYEAAEDLMVREGLDVLLIATNELERVDTVFHLTGYRAVNQTLAVLRPNKRPILIVTPKWESERASRRAPNWEVHGCNDFVDALSELFPHGVRSEKTATVNLRRLPAAHAMKLSQFVGTHAKEFDAELDTALTQKTEDEIEYARRASAIGEAAFERLIEITRIGMSEAELAVELKFYMEELGADDNFLLVTAAPHNRAVQPSSSRRLQRGDVILVEITPTYHGQLSQICRTAVLGSPSNLLSEKYDLVVRAMEAGIKAVRPGARMSDVANAIDAVLSAQGYGEFCRPPHIRRRGHGLGRGSNAPGDVAPANDVMLEEDMVFVVHPNQYLPETGYLLCGEPVRVTADGVELLSKRIARLATVPM
jgi:Xaa-Pro dipeptidase